MPEAKMTERQQLAQLRASFANSSPMVRSMVGPVVAPLFDLLASLVARIEQLEQTPPR